MERQFFYLVCFSYDETTTPKKVFLQKHEAITWGRKQATKLLKTDDNYSVSLYKQEIARTSVLEFITYLRPYEN